MKHDKHNIISGCTNCILLIINIVLIKKQACVIYFPMQFTIICIFIRIKFDFVKCS